MRPIFENTPVHKKIDTLFSFAAIACIGLVTFGYAAIAGDGNDYGKSVAVQGDGKIIVAGYAAVGRADAIALVRHNSDGSLDTSFNGTGKVTTTVGNGDCHSDSLAVQNDGKIVVAGYSFNTAGHAEFTLVRYNGDGSLDTNFGKGGKVTTSIRGNSDTASSVVVQDNGKIVAVGYSLAKGNNDFALARYNTDGTLDTSFNSTGKVTVDFGGHDYGRSVAVQSDGRIIIAGNVTSRDDRQSLALARFNPDGSLDKSFNVTGKVIADLGGGNAEARSLAIQNDGKIIVGGFAINRNTENFALVRYNVDGSLDASFGAAGKVITAIGGSGSNGSGIALQTDGKVVVAGYSINESGKGYDFAVVRYNVNGSPDQSFGGGGTVTTKITNGDGRLNSVAVQSDGKIVAAGSASNGQDNDFAAVRYNANGSLDTSFNMTGIVMTAFGTGAVRGYVAEARNEAGMSMATINDPDGYTNVRDDHNKVIATVKTGERFVAEQPHDDQKRWQVHLKTGVTGLMDRTRIRLLPNEPLIKLNYDDSKKEWRKLQLQKVTENDEVAWQAKNHGVDYYKTLVRASEGDVQAIARFFSLADFMDGAAAESYFPEAWELFHIVGDKTFSAFVRRQSLDNQIAARKALVEGVSLEALAAPDHLDYLERHFPETTAILFRSEIVNWISPNGQYVIRKVFSNPRDLDNSKVTHAELIEKTTGKVLCDLSQDDIGTGAGREGRVLWSPDSKLLAYVSSDLTGSESRTPSLPPQRMQTTVYQLSGGSFARIDLPLAQPPGKETDPEIKGAVVGHEFITPTRWTKPKTLILERHDYYEKLTASSGSIHSFDRLYEIIVSFQEDGTATISWKLRNDR